MSDSVSRADAIEAVHEYYQKRFTEDSKWDADAKMLVLEDKTIAKDNMEICNIIKALPSAEAEWIPCSESLPKEYAQYLVCLESGECYVYWLEDSDWARGMAEKEGILAWMPLPEPYRKDGEA